MSFCVAPNETDTPFSGVPIGSMLLWGAPTAPSGYLLCDGSAINRISYALLFAVLGTTWGSGDGTTTFNVPNTSGKVVRGVNVTYALTSTGGADTVTLAANQLPNHGHTITDPTHFHSAVGLGTGYTAADGGNGNRASVAPTAAASTGITIADSLLLAGVQVSQVATSLVNAYVGINYIIKSGG